MRLIDADELIVMEYGGIKFVPVEFINDAPTIEERKTGKWEKTITYYPYCSICEWMPEEDEMTHGLYNYCPYCGARMEGEGE